MDKQNKPEEIEKTRADRKHVAARVFILICGLGAVFIGVPVMQFNIGAAPAEAFPCTKTIQLTSHDLPSQLHSSEDGTCYRLPSNAGSPDDVITFFGGTILK